MLNGKYYVGYILLLMLDYSSSLIYIVIVTRSVDKVFIEIKISQHLLSYKLQKVDANIYEMAWAAYR